MAQAASAADDTAGEAGPAHPYVEALTGLPGVEHVAVVDVSGQHVLGEWGGPPGSADALLDRARAAASRSGRRELEDVVSTTPSAFHLSRLVLAGPGHPESVWVALRVDRAQGSLPWSRAALAGLDGPTGAPVPRAHIPAPRDPAPVVTAPVVMAPVVPAPRIVPPPPVAVRGPAPLPAPVPAVVVAPGPPPVAATPPAPPVAKAHVALVARVATPAPVSVPEPDPSPATAETPVAEVVEVAETIELRLPSPAVPEVRVEAPAPPRRSSFAPVMVVLPPPSPVPDDGTTEEPAPMPGGYIVAPDPADQDAPAADDAEDVGDVEPTDGADPTDAPPETTDEPRVMRRLIHGMRRRG